VFESFFPISKTILAIALSLAGLLGFGIAYTIMAKIFPEVRTSLWLSAPSWMKKRFSKGPRPLS